MHALVAITKPGKNDKRYLANLTSVVAQLGREVAGIQQGWLESRARAEVINGMLEHQNAVIGMLARHAQQHTSQWGSRVKAEPGLAADDPHPGLEQTTCTASSSSYVTWLVQQASAEQIAKVLSMTTKDWSAYFTSRVTRLVALLELVTRYDDPQQPPDDYTASDRPLPVPPGSAPLGYSLTADMQQLEAIVDEWVLFTVLALLMTPLQIARATSMNHALQREATAPPGYYTRVVQRLKLTPQQGLLLTAGVAEFNRLRSASFSETGALLSRAACPGLMVLAAKVEQGATALREAARRLDAAAASQPGAPSADASLSGTAGADGEQACCMLRQASNRGDTLSSSGGSSGSSSLTAVASASSPGTPAPTKSLSGEEGGCSKGADAALAVCPAVLLVRSIQRAPMFAQLLHAINCSILTKLQIAQLVCACYPFIPVPAAVAEAAAQWYAQQKQEAAANDPPRPRGRPRKTALLQQLQPAQPMQAPPQPAEELEQLFWWCQE